MANAAKIPKVVNGLFKLVKFYFKMFRIEYLVESIDDTKYLDEIKQLLNIYKGKANQPKYSLKSFSKKPWFK